MLRPTTTCPDCVRQSHRTAAILVRLRHAVAATHMALKHPGVWVECYQPPCVELSRDLRSDLKGPDA